MDRIDELSFDLMLSGFEVVLNHECCIACASKELLARREVPGRQPFFLAGQRDETGRWQLVAGSYESSSVHVHALAQQSFSRVPQGLSQHAESVPNKG